jgi:hypothetical protein
MSWVIVTALLHAGAAGAVAEKLTPQEPRNALVDPAGGKEQGMGMRFTELEQAVLEFMANDAEPTWIFLKEMPELGEDRGRLERILVDLEARGMVSRTRELSVNPDAKWSDLDDWWALTPLGRSAVRE